MTINTITNQKLSSLSKIIILFSLLASSLYAEAKVYVGSSVGYFHETFNNEASGNSTGSNMARLKLGYGEREAYAIEFSLDYIDNKSTTFSGTNGSDEAKYGLNIELVKAFDWDLFILPYFKAGFGGGFLDVNIADNGATAPETINNLTYSSLNLGLGFFIPLSETFDFEVGYDYKSISYEQKDKTEPLENQVNSNANIAYLGFNVRF